jgi:phosphoribosylanthranilate isomerase
VRIKPVMRVKICGLTRLADALWAAERGADYLGFIFAASPRRVTAELARDIIGACPAAAVKVGVFVDETRESIRRTISEAGLDMIQLHGHETPEFCRGFDLPVIKAIRARGEEDFRVLSKYSTEYILLESSVPGRIGGTGKTGNWPLAARAVAEFPEKKFFLAGGLNPENISSAIRAVHPYAVDVASGVESGPGIKDHTKIESLLEAVRKL